MSSQKMTILICDGRLVNFAMAHLFSSPLGAMAIAVMSAPFIKVIVTFEALVS